jgi:hypothetical protein
MEHEAKKVYPYSTQLSLFLEHALLCKCATNEPKKKKTLFILESNTMRHFWSESVIWMLLNTSRPVV